MAENWCHFDGDGISDFILWRPTTASFYILRSTDNFELSRHWVVALGSPGDQPLVGDFDGAIRN